jgi:hypothetical protein
MMGQLNVKEQDFADLQEAANNAYDSGDHELAERLDVLARKANAALTRDRMDGYDRISGVHEKVSWKDMPSCLRHNILKEIAP